MSQFEEGHPGSKCLVCNKPILVKSARGKFSTGFCSRVCASMQRFAKKYVGPRSEVFSNPINLEGKRKE